METSSKCAKHGDPFFKSCDSENGAVVVLVFVTFSARKDYGRPPQQGLPHHEGSIIVPQLANLSSPDAFDLEAQNRLKEGLHLTGEQLGAQWMYVLREICENRWLLWEFERQPSSP